MARKKQASHSWKDVRSVLNKASHKDLLGLVGDLYALRRENQDFLHARFLKGDDALVPYKETIEQYISPAEPWKHPIRISLARKAISDYRKAVGDSQGLAELMLFYAECGVNFTLEFGDTGPRAACRARRRWPWSSNCASAPRENGENSMDRISSPRSFAASNS